MKQISKVSVADITCFQLRRFGGAVESIWSK